MAVQGCKRDCVFSPGRNFKAIFHKMYLSLPEKSKVIIFVVVLIFLHRKEGPFF